MGSIFRRNPAPGSTKSRCGAASWLGGCSNVAIAMRPTLLKRVWLTTGRSIIPIMPTHIGGRIPGNPSSERRRLVTHAVNNGRDERGCTLGPNDLHEPSLHPDPISGPLHNWQRTYEMDI